MEQQQRHTARDVPRLLEQLREQVQSETRRPVSATIIKLSDAIELAAALPEGQELQNDEWLALGLTPTESALAALLKSKFGKPVSRDAMMAHLYGGADESPGSEMIGVLACKINKKLAGTPLPCRLVSIYGFGYKMVDGAHETRHMMAERNEWRDGIFMGPVQMKVADVLYRAKGKWVRTPELREQTAVRNQNMGAIVSAIRNNFKGSRYVIETARRHGYRLTVKQPYPVN